MKKKFQIVVDSSSDMLASHFKNSDILFNVVPLTINVDKNEFIDNELLEIPTMLKEMNSFSGKSTSSCPPVGKFEETFLLAENTICITISSKLSGTYNSACLGAEMARDKGCNVHVIDSKLTSGAMMLIAEKCHELMTQDKGFEFIVNQLEEYTEKRTLLFVLDKFDNLIKNGRMSKVTGVIAGFLKIKPIATGVDGDIKLVDKKRTTTMAIKRLVEMIGEKIQEKKDVDIVITHCFNDEVAKDIENEVKSKFSVDNVRIISMRGLCSFYALEKGIIVSM